MKKLFLLCALVCAGQMYGMEPKKPLFLEIEHISELPKDIHQKIIKTALETTNHPYLTIMMIERLSAMQGIQGNKLFDKLLGNLKDFTKLVHMLADRSKMTPVQVAVDLTGSTAQKYVALSNSFELAVLNGWIETAERLIAQEVDFVADPCILMRAVPSIVSSRAPKAEMVKLLLNHGANPFVTENDETPLQRLNRLHQNSAEYQQIKTLLEDAMKTYQQ